MASADPLRISVLVADDDEEQRVLMEALLKGGEGVRHIVTMAEDGRTALTALRNQVFDVALLDLSMPELDGIEVFEAIAGDPVRPQVIFVSGRGTVAAVTKAMKLGAYDFVEKPVDRDRLRTLVWKAAQARRMQTRSERLGALVQRGTQDARIVSKDPHMAQTLELLNRVAPSNVSVLVVGESGTGKELIARDLHRLSNRHDQPMVALNCASVSESLAESELFGHEKGSFTGALARKLGLVELADGGTLFLDEIGDLDQSLQAKLLRTLESRSFRRVGGTKELQTDFRLVSATNRPLPELVGEGAFRGDLYYRINAIVLELPPLRDRAGDILLLAKHFLSEMKPGEGSWTFAPDAKELLEAYSWPGNVRELRNVVERAALLCRNRVIRAEDLGVLNDDLDGVVSVRSGNGLPSLNLERLERVAIEEALELTGWHQGRAAEMLGISDRTLHRKIRSIGLRRPE
jgi:DNA-binding NtrC family response regulator